MEDRAPGVAAAVEDFARFALIQAARVAPQAHRRMTVGLGPATLRIESHGAAMTDVAIRTLAHAATDDARAAVELAAIDARSAGVERPPVWLFPAAGPRAWTNRMSFDGGNLSAILNAEWRAWLIHDRAAGRAVIWAGDVAAVPEWVIYDQIRNLLHLLAAGEGWGLLHAAALRHAGAGLLLTGPSGAGKSTTTAASLRGGFDTAGDDFVLVTDGPGQPEAQAIFDTIKLTDRSLDLLPELTALIRNPLRRIEDKALVHLSEVAPARFASGFPLHAILHCRVSGVPESRIAPCAPALALKALAPSTVFLLRDRHEEIFRRCAALSRRLPTHAFAIGTDLDAAVACLRAFAGTLVR